MKPFRSKYLDKLQERDKKIVKYNPDTCCCCGKSLGICVC